MMIIYLLLGQDGAEPAVASVAAMNLIRLYTITGKVTYKERYDQLIKSLENVLANAPHSRPATLSAILFELSDPLQVKLLYFQNILLICYQWNMCINMIC